MDWQEAGAGTRRNKRGYSKQSGGVRKCPDELVLDCQTTVGPVKAIKLVRIAF